MKTDFNVLKKLVEGIDIGDIMLDHDMNITILNPDLKKKVTESLDLKNLSDVSRFLTFIISATEGDGIEDEMLGWSEDEYGQYLRNVGIDEETDKGFVEEFLNNL